MSLKKFIQNFWQGIKKIFEGLEPKLKEAIHIGVSVVDKMKTFVESPEADILTILIPGTIDDKIREALRLALPKILTEMKLVDATLGLTDPKEITTAGVKALQQITGDWISDGARKNFYDSLAVLIAQVAADGKLSWDDGKIILKWYYDNVQKPVDPLLN